MSDTSLPYSAAGRHNPWLIAVAVSIATFMEVLDTTIANVALRHIAGSLAASQDESTYVLTSYLVSNAIVVPISGWLATMIGRKRFYMICVGIFTFGSVMCGTSQTLGQIVFWRIVQGFGGGGLAPVEQSIFADSFPPRLRPQAFALYGFTIVLAPAIGPILGGWLTDQFSWRWVFLINLPFGLLSLALVAWLISDSPALRRDRAAQLARGLPMDYFGFALVAFGFGALQIVLDRFEREDGFSSPLILVCSIIAGASLLTLVVWEVFHPQPVMNVRLLGKRGFAASCVLMLIVGFVLITSTQLLPQLAQTLLGYDATTAGLTLGLAGFATLLLMPVSGIVTGRLIQPRFLVFVAFVGTAFAMFYACTLDLSADFAAFSFTRLLQAIWLPFLFIPISSASLVGIPAAQNGDASALMNLMRNLGGSIGVSYCTTLLARRTSFHTARLAEHITPYNGWGWGSALGDIAHRIDAQAQMLTYIDLFLILGLTALLVAPVAFLLPRLPKGAAATGH